MTTDTDPATVTVRYIANDVAAAMDFYSGSLGFDVVMNPSPGFAMLRRGALRLAVNAPGAGGGGTAGAAAPSPGGWNRFQLQIDDLDPLVEQLRNQGVAFRGDIVIGNGGRQAVIEDPSGNPVELFEPKR